MYSFFDRVEEGLIDQKYYKTKVIFHNLFGINGEPQVESTRRYIHVIDLLRYIVSQLFG